MDQQPNPTESPACTDTPALLARIAALEAQVATLRTIRIGQAVQFYSSKSGGFALPALITLSLYGGKSVNVIAFDASGTPIVRHGIPTIREGEAAPGAVEYCIVF